MIHENIKSDDNRLKSSQLYDLKGLFVSSDNSKIVIPDLQRDYCWGTTGNLVVDFVDNLIKHFEENRSKDLIIGLIYGYYEKERPYLQLCDGQQRLTTLYLLLGLLNIMSEEENPFQDFLISDFEYNLDDKEPTLLYAIRDSSLYFLSDLVCKFFIKSDKNKYAWQDNIPSDFIKKQSWWFHEYESDPTIQSMLVALDKMAELLKDKKFDVIALGKYITEHLFFVYYNMGNRKDGEETFVIINTTGEPLTSTENLKPLVVTHDDKSKWKRNSEIWETIDNYFWNHRRKDEETSDLGMKEFLRMVAAIFNPERAIADYLSREKNDFKFPYENISIQQIDTVFQNFKKLDTNPTLMEICQKMSLTASGEFSKQKDLKEYFVILPLIKYLMEHPSAEDIDIKRVYEFLYNITRYTVIRSQENQIADAIHVLSKLEGNDICGLLDMDAKEHKILTDEELLRLRIYKENESKRESIEQLFDDMSKRSVCPVLHGRISTIIKWAGFDENGCFNKDKFALIKQKFEQLFFKYHQTVSDLTAISFACSVDMDKYPVHTGSDNYSFLYNLDDWYDRFFKGDTSVHTDKIDSDKSASEEDRLSVKLGKYIDTLKLDDMVSSQISIIDSWLLNASHSKNIFFQFVEYFKQVGFWKSNGYNIKFNEGGSWGRMLRIKDTRFTQIIYSSNNNYRDIYLYGNAFVNSGEKNSKWKRIECWKGDYVCLFSDLINYDVAIELYFDDDSLGYLSVFQRDNGKKKLPFFDKVVQEFELKEDDKEKAGIYYSSHESPKDIMDKMNSIREFIASSLS